MARGPSSHKPSSKGSKYARGSKALSICDRSGRAYPYHEMVTEPGTNLRVHYTESDGYFNIVDHPQNRVTRVSESINLQYPRADRNEVETTLSLYFQTETSGDFITDEVGTPLTIEV